MTQYLVFLARMATLLRRWRLNSRLRFAIPLVALCCGSLAGYSRAESGFTLVAPSGGKPSRSGLTLSIDTSWVEGYGYRPVEVQVKSAKPSPADRLLTISLRTNPQYYFGSMPIEVMQDFELPAGATTASTTVAVPQYSQWQMVSWDLMVDGELVGDLSGQNYTGGRNSGAPRSIPRFLVVIDSPKQKKNLKRLFTWCSNRVEPGYIEQLNGIITNNRLSVNTTFVQGKSNAESINITSSKLAELPDQWILYSSLDVVCLSSQQLTTLKQQHPNRWKAINSWLSAGGNLWVYDIGAKWERLPEVEQALQIQNDADFPANALQRRGWILPTGREPVIEPENTFATQSQMDYDQFGNLVDTTESDEEGDDSEKDESSKEFDRDKKNPHFALRDVQFGRVVAVASDTPFASANDPLSWVLGAVGKRRYLWAQRYGLSPDETNPSYWNFLIPDVGFAPVNAFRVLITLFVLGIGPLNYVLLKRRKRLQWLILTVPLGATIVTLSLFAYALISDGLGVRVRARSIAQLDQRTGEETRWSRLSYYAGLAPGDGLTFDQETILFPILPNNSGNYSYRNREMQQERELQWYDDQRLTYGWLKSRTPTQYLAVSSAPTKRRLVIEEKDGSVSVRNELGVPVESLYLIDSTGALFSGSSLAVAATDSLQPTHAAKVYEQLSTIMKDNQPRIPRDMRSFVSDYGNWSANQWNNNTNDYGATRLEQNRLERTAYELGQPISVVKPDDAKPLPGATNEIFSRPRTYVAIVRELPEESRGAQDVTEEASFHVIIGRW